VDVEVDIVDALGIAKAVLIPPAPHAIHHRLPDGIVALVRITQPIDGCGLGGLRHASGEILFLVRDASAQEQKWGKEQQGSQQPHVQGLSSSRRSGASCWAGRRVGFAMRCSAPPLY